MNRLQNYISIIFTFYFSAYDTEENMLLVHPKYFIVYCNVKKHSKNANKSHLLQNKEKPTIQTKQMRIKHWHSHL